MASTIDIPESELSEEFIRASGQENVNKVSVAVELRFDRRASMPLSVRG